MFKFEVIVEDGVIDNIIGNIRMYGLELTNEQCEEFLKENLEIVHELARVEWDFDTVVRETFIDTFADQLVGLSWPIGSSSADETNHFYKEFKKKCDEKGYKFKYDESEEE